MKQIMGYIHSVETFGALDGPGIRYVVFLQGCPLRCRYCHNADTWQAGAAGARYVSAQAVVDDILAYLPYIRTGGVTLSGGEPLFQPEFACEILRLCHENGLHTAVDTSGGVPLASCEEAVRAADLLLLDIKALDPAECLALTGADNSAAFAMLRLRERLQKDVWVRHVLVPGLTLDFDKLEKLAAFLEPFTCVKRVELLPFHKMGEYKWEQLGLPYTLGDVREPTAEEMQRAAEILRRYGLRGAAGR